MLSFLGVDPGHKGAAAVITMDIACHPWQIHSLNTARFIAEINHNLKTLSYFSWDYAFVEQQRIVFGQRGALVTAGNFGQILGYLKGDCNSQQFDGYVNTVTPAHWQRTVHGHSTSVKKETIEWAKKMFDRDNLSDGEADALGIAWHGVMQTMSKQ